jgi:hypothetical protein
MKVRTIDPENLLQYDVLARSYGGVFNTIDWLRLFGKSQHCVGIYEDGGELIGGFCFYEQKRLGLRILTNPPFTPHCGPFLKVKAQHPVAVLETWRETMQAIAGFLKNIPHRLSLLRFSLDVVDMLPFFWDGYHVTPFYTYRLDVSNSEEAIYANMASVRRRNIQRATKDGIEVAPITDLRIVQRLVEGTFARQKKPVDGESLRRILFQFSKPENSYALGAFKDRTAIACTFVVYDRQTAYYLLGGHGEEEKHHGAGALAMWASIKRARQLGLRTFDFEGSVIPAIERYFRGFGGQLTPYFGVTKAWLPLEIALKFKLRHLF